MLIGGRISGAIGHRRAFTIGLLGFAAASLLGGMAWDPAPLIGARTLQGRFAALLAPAALSILSVSFTDARERGRAFGVYAAIGATVSAIGLVLGGLLTEHTSWRWCLYVNVPIAILTAIGAVRLPAIAPLPRTGRIDFTGAALSAVGIATIVLGVSEAETREWTSPTVIGLLAAGVVLLSLFVYAEKNTANPVLPLTVVRNRVRSNGPRCWRTE